LLQAQHFDVIMLGFVPEMRVFSGAWLKNTAEIRCCEQ
jgi:hypothetical protein